MAYQPFLIADYKDGLRHDVEPWLLPVDAWSKMLDAYLDKGVIKKRLGYRELDRFVEAKSTITGISKATVGVVTSASHGLTDDTIIRIVGVSGMVEVNGNTYVVSNAAANTFELKDLAGVDVVTTGFTTYTSGGKTCVYTTDSIMGIMTWVNTSGVEQLIVANRDRLCSWSTSGEYFEPITSVFEILGYGDGTTVAYTITGLTNIPAQIITGSVTVTATISSTTVTLTDNGASPTAVLSSGAHAGTFTWVTGATSLTFAAAPDKGTEIKIRYTFFGDLFTGDSEDFFNWMNFDGKLWMTNGEDSIITYDGTYAGIPLIDPNSDPGVHASTVKVTSCKDIKAERERLLLFNTKEGGVWNPERIRWSQAGSSTIWQDSVAGKGDFIDVSTGDHFQWAELIKGKILVGFQKSKWILNYTGDPNLAFRIDRVSLNDNTDAPFVKESFDDFVLSLGAENINICDGNSVKRIDDKIPNQSLEIDQDFIQKSFSVRLNEEEQVWITYVNKKGDNTTSSQDRILVWNYKDSSWSIFRIPMSCLGRYFENSGKRLNDFPGMTLKDFEGMRLNDFSFLSNSAITLGGSHEGGSLGGKVWIMNFGSIDHFSNLVAKINDITAASPGNVTTEYIHGLSTGDSVRISGVSGMTEVNNINYTVTVIDTKNFTIGVDTTDYTTYTTGGEVYYAKGVSFELTSAKWNPFNQQGRDTRLGYIDFYLTQDSDDKVTVDFYLNEDSDSYQTSTLSFDGVGEKVWKRLHSGAVGNTHSIKITDSSTEGEWIALHAIRLSVEPAGRGIL